MLHTNVSYGIVIVGVKIHTLINSGKGALIAMYIVLLVVYIAEFCCEDEIGGGATKTKTRGGA